MKRQKILKFFIMIIMLLTSTQLFSAVDGSGYIIFNDNNLKQALLNHNPEITDNNRIHWTEAQDFNGYLELNDKEITDISGLEYFTSAKSISLRRNNISDFSILSACTALESLILSDNNITSLNVGAEFTNLKYLLLENNNITSLDGFQYFPNLDKLYVMNSNISDLSALISGFDFSEFSIMNNQIKDITPLLNGSASILNIIGNPINGTGLNNEVLLHSKTINGSQGLGTVYFYVSSGDVTETSNLVEDTLNSASVTVTLDPDTAVFKYTTLSTSYFGIYNVPAGTYVKSVEYINPTQAKINIGFSSAKFADNYSNWYIQINPYILDYINLNDTVESIYAKYLKFWEDLPMIDGIPNPQTFVPSNNNINASLTDDFKLTFDEAITINTGNIYLYDENDNLIDTIDVTDTSKVTLSGRMLIIKHSKLERNKKYYILTDAGIVEDTVYSGDASNKSPAITSKTTWTFTGTERIDFPDANLKTALLGQMSPLVDTNKDGYITVTEAEAFTEGLLINNRNISDLTGMEYFINTTKIDAYNNNISDLTPISNLTSLTSLNLFQNNISDLSLLSNLTNLTTLHLALNNISDINPLSSLTELITLGLGDNNISDVSVLSNMTKLELVAIYNNNISNISSLTSLSALQKLYIYGNNISDLTPLSNLNSIQTLDARDNQINDLISLENLSGLTSLKLSGNQLTDISSLNNLTLLSYLNVANNNISNPIQLLNLNITDLYLANNGIDYSGLINSVKLGSLTTQDMFPEDIDIYVSSGTVDECTNMLERNLDNATVTLTLAEATFTSNTLDAPKFTLVGVPAGVTVESVDWVSDTQARVNLAFDGTDFDTDYSNWSITINKDIIDYTKLNAIGEANHAQDLIFTEGLAIIEKNLEVETLVPANNITGVSRLNDFIITYDKDISIASGNIYIYDSTNSLIETIDVTDSSKVSVSSKTLTVSHVDLDMDTTYYIKADSGIVTTASGNILSIIDDKTNWTFTTTDKIEFPDANLKSALLNHTGGIDANSDGEISVSESQNRTALLNLSNKSISDLTGLEFFINVSDLRLGVNSISDLTPLSTMTALTSLQLNNNNITDITALSSLVNLKLLYIYSNTISDINALSNLTLLETLHMQSNMAINDLSPLSNLTTLKILYAHGNNISNLNPLSNLTNLEQLNLGNNDISNVNALSNLTKLTFLSIYQNNINDISLLNNLIALTQFDFYENNILDISILSNFTSLTSSFCNNNSFSDVSSLSNLSSLSTFFAQNNNISNPIQLLNLNIANLYLDNNNIDYSGLTNSVKLGSLATKDMGGSVDIYVSSGTVDSYTNMLERNLDDATVTLTLIPAKFKSNILNAADFTLSGVPSGVTIESVEYISETQAKVNLAFDGTDFNTKYANWSITINKDIIDYNELSEPAETTYAKDLVFSDDLPVIEKSLQVETLVPANNATGVSRLNDFTMTYDKDISVASGNIYIYDSNDSLIDTIDVTDSSKVSISSKTLTVSHVDLDMNTTYYLKADSGIVTAANSDSSTIINDKTTWTFTTTDKIEFPDANLKTALLSHNPVIDINGDNEISVSEAEAVIDLRLSFKNISNITGLEYFSNLSKLDLGSNQVSDISHLSNMIKLTMLTLSSNQISDVNVLSNLTKLETLSLNDNQIKDISALKELKYLSFLELYNNEISVLPEFISNYFSTLDLKDNQINDISSLVNISLIDMLSLSRNNLTNIIPLLNINISFLEVFNNNIPDINSNNSIKLASIPGSDVYVSSGTVDSYTNMLERNLDDATVILTLTPAKFKSNILNAADFTLAGVPSGVTIESVEYISETQAKVNLAFDGTDFNTKYANWSITINKDIIDYNELSEPAETTYAKDLVFSDDLPVIEKSLQVETLVPANNATGVSRLNDFTMTYDKDISVASGNIYIYDSNDSLIDTIDVTDSSKVSISSKTLTVSHVDLDMNTTYYLKADSGIVTATNSDSSTIIDDKTTWTFTTTDNIEFPDANLKAKLLSYIPAINTNGDSEISVSEAEAVTGVLGLSGNSISDITGLEYFTNIVSLELYSNNINDIAVLDNLSSLEILNMYSNQISDISGIENLINLKELDISSNQISDISTLENLVNLTSLKLNENDISDLSRLRNLTNLITLELGMNNIIDITSLENMTKLKYLSLMNNNISDISTLDKLVDLEALALNGNNVSNISSLEGLVNLGLVALSDNNISDISPLKNRSIMQQLYLENNNIRDITSLLNLSSSDIYIADNTLNDSTLINAVNLGNLSTDDVGDVAVYVSSGMIDSYTNMEKDNLDNATVTLTLIPAKFKSSILNATDFTLSGVPAGVTVESIDYISEAQVKVNLAFDGTYFNTDYDNWSITIKKDIVDYKDLNDPAETTYAKDLVFRDDLPTIETSLEIIAFTPVNNAIDIAIVDDLKLKYSKNIIRGTGNIYIYDSNNNLIDTIDVADTSKVSVNSDTLVISHEQLEESKIYYILTDEGIVESSNGSKSREINNKTDWTFTTGDFEPIVTNGNIRVTSIGSGINGAYIVGDTITVEWDNTLSTGDKNKDIKLVEFYFLLGEGDGTALATNINDIWKASYTLKSGTYRDIEGKIGIAVFDNSDNRAFKIYKNNKIVDNKIPTITSVEVPVDGTYSSGKNLDFVVKTNENVVIDTSTGTPRLAITIGSDIKYARYVSGSNSNSLLFRYVVEEELEDLDGIELGTLIELNGGKLTDDAGNNIDLTLNSIASLINIKVNSKTPKGYTVSILEEYINSKDKNLTFLFSGAEIGTTYNYSIKDEDDSTVDISGNGIIATGTDAVQDIDVSSLSDGVLTLEVTLTNVFGNVGEKVAVDISKDTVVDGIAFLLPSTDSITVNTDCPLVIKFKEKMIINTGNIYICKKSDDSIVETIDITSANVSLDEKGRILTTCPSNKLSGNNEYYILIDKGALKDVYDNEFDGISDKTLWKFKTLINFDAKFTMSGSYENSSLEAGDIITYEIKIKGTYNEAHNAIIYGVVPSNTEYVKGSTTVDGQVINDNNGKLPLLENYNLGELSASGKVISYKVKLNENAVAGTSIKNQAELIIKNSNGNIIGNLLSSDIKGSSESETELFVGDTAMLEASYDIEDENGGEIKEGDILKLTINLKNRGNKKAEGISINNSIPENTTLYSQPILIDASGNKKTAENLISSETVSVSNTNKNVLSKAETSKLSIDIGDLASNESVVMSFEVKVNTGNTAPKLTSIAEISSKNASSVIASETVVTQNNPYIEMNVDIIDLNGDCLQAEDIIRYEIELENTGKTLATNIDITNLLPSEMLYIADSTTVNGRDYTDIVNTPLNFNDYVLNSGEKLTVKFKAKIKSGLSENQIIKIKTSYTADDSLEGSIEKSIQLGAIAEKLVIKGIASSILGNKATGWIAELRTGDVVLSSKILDETGIFNFSGLSADKDYTLLIKHPDTSVSYSHDFIKDKETGTIVDEAMWLDPAGVIYNSITRNPVQGAKVYLYGPDNNLVPESYLGLGQQGQSTGDDGYYNFDIDFSKASAGKYFIRVSAPNGYASATPSKIILPILDETSAGYDPTGQGDPFKVVAKNTAPQQGEDTTYYMAFDLAFGDPEILNNHIAIDPEGEALVSIVKKADKEMASAGDFVTYTLTVTNNSSSDLSTIKVYDKIPAGFKYINNSALINHESGNEKLNPSGNRLMYWNTSLTAGSSMTIKYTLVVGTGVVVNKKYTNIAYVKQEDITISNIAKADVLIINDADLDGVMVVGKVFYDENNNGIQDSGEKGLAGIRIISTSGEIITTDKFGRYHLVLGEDRVTRTGWTLVLKLDKKSLPEGREIVSDNPLIIKISDGLMEKANFRIK